MESLLFFTSQSDEWDQPGSVGLRATYGDGSEGWAMQGRYWALCGIVAREGGVLDLRDKVRKDFTVKRLDLSPEKLAEFLAHLVTCKLAQFEDEQVTIPSIDNDLGRKAKKSEEGKKAAAARWKGQKNPAKEADPPNTGKSQGAQAQTPEPVAPATPENAPAMQAQCGRNADAMRAHYGRNAIEKKREEKRERPLQGLSLFESLGKNSRDAIENQSSSSPPSLPLPQRMPPERQPPRESDEEWASLARLWGPLFEWAAQEQRGGNRINPLRFSLRAPQEIPDGMLAAGA